MFALHLIRLGCYHIFITFDSEFQEEPLSALNEADLYWSILTTHMQYMTAAEYSCFKPMNDSPLFQSFKEQNFSERECVKDISDEHIKEVSCELTNSSNFEEHVNVTNYIPRKVYGSRGT